MRLADMSDDALEAAVGTFEVALRSVLDEIYRRQDAGQQPRLRVVKGEVAS